jgi:hypothetical protein
VRSQLRGLCTPKEIKLKATEMMQYRSLLLGVGIGLFFALAVLVARYVSDCTRKP